MTADAELERKQRLCEWARQREAEAREACGRAAAERARLVEARAALERELALAAPAPTSVAVAGHARRYHQALQARLGELAEAELAAGARLEEMQAAVRQAARETAGFERLLADRQHALLRRGVRAEARSQDERAAWQTARSDP